MCGGYILVGSIDKRGCKDLDVIGLWTDVLKPQVCFFQLLPSWISAITMLLFLNGSHHIWNVEKMR